MRTTLLTLMAIVPALYLALCAAAFLMQRSMIYYPQPSAYPMAERLTLAGEGADVAVSMRHREGPKALIYFGGNAEDVSANLPSLPEAFPEHAIYLMNYRGYGGSSGTPSEHALQQDALLLFDSVHKEHPEITVMGRSLGSGLAVRLAAERPVSHLVLVTPFDSLAGMAAAHFPYLPVRWLLIDKYESGRHAPKVNVPTLILAAERDEVVPRSSTEQLRERFRPGIATFEVIGGTGHNTISESPAYWSALRAIR